jgi:hypothetical protein
LVSSTELQFGTFSRCILIRCSVEAATAEVSLVEAKTMLRSAFPHHCRWRPFLCGFQKCLRGIQTVLRDGVEDGDEDFRNP